MTDSLIQYFSLDVEISSENKRLLNSGFESLKKTWHTNLVQGSQAFKDGVKKSMFEGQLGRKLLEGQRLAERNGLASFTRATCQQTMHWATFRATIRRQGVFRNYDFNESLSQPLLDTSRGQWNEVFNASIPNHLVSFIFLSM